MFVPRVEHSNTRNVWQHLLGRPLVGCQSRSCWGCWKVQPSGDGLGGRRSGLTGWKATSRDTGRLEQSVQEGGRGLWPSGRGRRKMRQKPAENDRGLVVPWVVEVGKLKCFRAALVGPPWSSRETGEPLTDAKRIGDVTYPCA